MRVEETMAKTRGWLSTGTPAWLECEKQHGESQEVVTPSRGLQGYTESECTKGSFTFLNSGTIFVSSVPAEH